MSTGSEDLIPRATSQPQWVCVCVPPPIPRGDWGNNAFMQKYTVRESRGGTTEQWIQIGRAHV